MPILCSTNPYLGQNPPKQSPALCNRAPLVSGC